MDFIPTKSNSDSVTWQKDCHVENLDCHVVNLDGFHILYANCNKELVPSSRIG
jgi:hypothetical protein